MIRMLWLLLLCAELAVAGVVERKVEDQNYVVVKLSKIEKSQLSDGQSVSLNSADSDPVIGKIKSIKGNKALIEVDFGIESLSNGQTVQFANVKSNKTKKKRERAQRQGNRPSVFDGEPRLPVKLREHNEPVYLIFTRLR